MYTALVTRNRRDISSGDPKVLLLDIKNATTGLLFRDHAWISESKLNASKPHKNKQKTYIQFEATPITYTEGKQTLTKIRNIVIKKIIK